MQTKEKYQLEVTVNASPQLIYQYISTPAGLASWYADDVRANDDTYTFVWNGFEETAQLLRPFFAGSKLGSVKISFSTFS